MTKPLIRLYLLSAILLSCAFSSAHEGHDKTPGALAAPHGGFIKGTDHLYLELVVQSAGVKIYPLDHATKAIPVAKLSLEGKMTIPRRPKTEPVAFLAEGDHFVATIDSKGAHRYELEVLIKYNGGTERVKFSVEPQ